MQFPTINISEKLFQKNNEFTVFESNKIKSTYLEIKSDYLNEEFIDSAGKKFVLTQFKNVDSEKHLITGSVYWWPIEWVIYGIEKYMHRKKIDYLYELNFKPIEGTVTLAALKVIVLDKIADYHFIENKLDMESFIADVNNCSDYQKLLHLVSEKEG